MRNATVRSAPVLNVLEPAWLEGEFITTVHKGQKARHGDHRSAQALIGHVGGRGDRGPPARLDQGHQWPGGLDGYLWIKGTNGRAVSMAIFHSDGAQGVDSSTSYAIVPRCR